jgi:hypothetical protein
MFDAHGHFAQFITRSDLPKFAAGTANKATADEAKAVLSGFVRRTEVNCRRSRCGCTMRTVRLAAGEVIFELIQRGSAFSGRDAEGSSSLLMARRCCSRASHALPFGQCPVPNDWVTFCVICWPVI